MVTKITVLEALKTKAIFIDTRTPKEFKHDHLPGAINLPILSNEERAIIGTLFKQVSREKAIEKGMEFFSPKLPDFLKTISEYKDQEIIIYCWRGGMRSRTVVALFEALGYNVKQLEYGHKAYRAYVRAKLDSFQLKPTLVVLSGLTCTGKTDILHLFENSLDLEGLAQHRGSLYGSLNLQPNSQIRFENLLLKKLQELNHYEFLYVEGESRRIGDLIIPPSVWKAMVNGVQIKITRDLNLRAEACVKEYFKDNVEEIISITRRLWKVIGKENKELVLTHLNNQEYFEASKILLEKYYDPLYQNTLNKRTFQTEISSNDLDEAKQQLISFVSEL